MKNKELKTALSLSKSFLIGGFLLWVLETAIFLIIEGWHYKATNPIEIQLDETVDKMWTCSLMLIIFYIIHKFKSNKI